MLAEDAIKAAVKDYETKRAKSTTSPQAASVENAVNVWFLLVCKNDDESVWRQI